MSNFRITIDCLNINYFYTKSIAELACQNFNLNMKYQA